MSLRRRPLLIGVVLIALLVIGYLGRRALVGGGHGGEAAGNAGSGGGGSAEDPWSGPRRPLRVGSGDVDPSVMAAGPAVVEGTVRDGATHQPVDGAEVVFWNKKGEQTTSSGPDGHYRIEITVGAWSCGARDGDARVTVPQNVQVSASTPAIDFELQPLAHVHGVVRDGGGRATAGAEVTYNPNDRAAREALDASVGRTVQSGADGSFRLPVLPGAVPLRAVTPHQMAHRVVPGVGPGADVQADLTLVDQVAIDGRVVDDRGAPVAGAEVTVFVSVTDVDLNTKRLVTTDGSGRFAAAGLNAGWLTLAARTPDGARSKDLPMFELSHGDVHDLVLAMVAPAPVTGRVRYGDGSPARRAAIKAVRPGYAGRWAETTTDDRGEFSFAGPTDGAFEVTATTESGTGVVQGATTAAPVEIVIHQPGGVRGLVHHDHVAATDYTVAIETFVPADATGASPSRLPPQRFRAADGRFEWAHLDPGAYDLGVHAAGAAVAHVHAVVTDGKWTEVDVPLAAGATVTGRVHAGDKAIANARLDVACTGATAVTGADGGFALADLPAAGCAVTITADGYPPVQRTAQPGAALDVALTAPK